jgi:hypothetical protein
MKSPRANAEKPALPNVLKCKMQTAMIARDLAAFWKARRAERNGLSDCRRAICNPTTCLLLLMLPGGRSIEWNLNS